MKCFHFSNPKLFPTFTCFFAFFRDFFDRETSEIWKWVVRAIEMIVHMSTSTLITLNVRTVKVESLFKRILCFPNVLGLFTFMTEQKIDNIGGVTWHRSINFEDFTGVIWRKEFTFYNMLRADDAWLGAFSDTWRRAGVKWRQIGRHKDVT